MDFLYQEILMDHYRHPRNWGCLSQPTFSSDHHNPSCGDKVQVQGIVAEGRLHTLVFEGTGCVISLATASLLTEAVRDKTVEEIAHLSNDYIQNLIGMKLGLTRLKCALLPLQALQEGLEAAALSVALPCQESINVGSSKISSRAGAPER